MALGIGISQAETLGILNENIYLLIDGTKGSIIGLRRVHTRAEYAAKNGRFISEKNIFYLSNSQVYGVLRRIIRSV